MKEIPIPALRFGVPYHSLERQVVPDLGTGGALASLGLMLPNQIAQDCGINGRLEAATAALQSIPMEQRIQMCVWAAELFECHTLPCGDHTQTINQYTDQVARTSGLSCTLVRQNTKRIAAALRATKDVVHGLSRGVPYEAFDTGFSIQDNVPIRIIPRIKALGACMPNNSPGVHVVWLAAVAFGIPVLIRPGSAEPFTPYRLIQALIGAGFPKEAFGYYPCDYAGANRIPELTGGGIVFGSDETVAQWAHNPHVHVHGSGYSKLIIGEDLIDDWQDLGDELAFNVGTNSGRSCFNVSTILVPRHARAIAAALAEKLSELRPGSLDHPETKLSAMAMPDRARWVNDHIDEQLKAGGATDMSAPYQPQGRLVIHEGRTYLLPTVIHCDSMDHPLARSEFLFPYTAVVETSNDAAFASLGKTLSLAVYTRDEALKFRACRSRISLVSINTGTPLLDRTQPHEENLFELLFERLSFVAG